MTNNLKALIIFVSFISLKTLAWDGSDGGEDIHENDFCDQVAQCIGCATPCFGHTNDPFLIKASEICSSTVALTGLGGILLMFIGGTCFFPCFQCPEALGYSIIGCGAGCEAPLLAASVAKCADLGASVSGCHQCSLLMREARHAHGPGRWTLRSWWPFSAQCCSN